MGVLLAIANIIKAAEKGELSLSAGKEYGIRINQQGSDLEDFVEECFSGAILEKNKKEQLRDKTFCLVGTQNRPPDYMLCNGEPAIEVKKLKNQQASFLALNSSPPRQKLRANDSRITQAAKTAEKWSERKVIYAIGVVQGKVIKSLQLVYGECIAASEEHYSTLENKIKSSLVDSKIGDLLSDSNELGKIHAVDPLKATYLRIRGMWEMKNPLKIFAEQALEEYSLEDGFTLLAIMPKKEYKRILRIDSAFANYTGKDELSITNIKISDPDNPAKKIDAVLIKFVGA